MRLSWGENFLRWQDIFLGAGYHLVIILKAQNAFLEEPSFFLNKQDSCLGEQVFVLGNKFLSWGNKILSKENRENITWQSQEQNNILRERDIALKNTTYL